MTWRQYNRTSLCVYACDRLYMQAANGNMGAGVEAYSQTAPLLLLHPLLHPPPSSTPLHQVAEVFSRFER